MSDERKKIAITNFLTEDQIRRAVEIYRTAKPGSFATTVCEEIIQPNIQKINRMIGQENDPKYLAYLVEYVVGEYVRQGGK